MANFAFCAQIIFSVFVQGRSETFAKLFVLLALGRYTLCEFNKTKFVQIGQYLTGWRAAFQSCPKSTFFCENYQNYQNLPILGNFGKLPTGQTLFDLDKFCFAELTHGRSS